MAGALAERVFAQKLEAVGFVELEVHERVPIGLESLADYPLFTPDLLEVMGRLLTPEQKRQVAVALTMTARKRY